MNTSAVNGSRALFFKWAFPGPLFLYFRLFDTVNVQYKFCDDWIRTADLWNRKTAHQEHY